MSIRRIYSSNSMYTATKTTKLKKRAHGSIRTEKSMFTEEYLK